MASKNRDYKFITEPDDNLKCVICLEVAVEPKQQHEVCGKLFCKECIETSRSSYYHQPCPHCWGMNPQYFNDRKSYGEIRDLRVRCDNVEKGCDWKGTVGTLENHVPQCGFALVPCPNKCKVEGNDLQFLRNFFNKHLKMCPNRNYKCRLCGEKGTYISITEDHDKVCEKKMVLCPESGCHEVMQRSYIKEHVQTACNYVVVPCKYDTLGCCVKKMRKEIGEHEEVDDKSHLHLALEVVSQLKEICIKKEGKSMTFNLSGYSLMKENNKFYSKSFHTNPFGYEGLQISVYPNGFGAQAKGTHVSVYVFFLEKPHDSRLQWPFVGTVTVELLNQLADCNHHKMDIQSFTLRSQDNIVQGMFEQFIPHSMLFAFVGKQYLVEDTLYFRVTVDMDGHKPWLECTQPTT